MFGLLSLALSRFCQYLLAILATILCDSHCLGGISFLRCYGGAAVAPGGWRLSFLVKGAVLGCRFTGFGSVRWTLGVQFLPFSGSISALRDAPHLHEVLPATYFFLFGGLALLGCVSSSLRLFLGLAQWLSRAACFGMVLGVPAVLGSCWLVLGKTLELHE